MRSKKNYSRKRKSIKKNKNSFKRKSFKRKSFKRKSFKKKLLKGGNVGKDDLTRSVSAPDMYQKKNQVPYPSPEPATDATSPEPSSDATSPTSEYFEYLVELKKIPANPEYTNVILKEKKLKPKQYEFLSEGYPKKSDYFVKNTGNGNYKVIDTSSIE